MNIIRHPALTVVSQLLIFGVACVVLWDWLQTNSGQSLSDHTEQAPLFMLLGVVLTILQHQPLRIDKKVFLPGILGLLTIATLLITSPSLHVLTSLVGLAYVLSSYVSSLLGILKRGGPLFLLLLFLIPILAGSLALISPRCSSSGEEPLDFNKSLFTSISAVSVTGLSVVDIGRELSIEGQCVLLFLIQIGGLGTVTFFVLFMSILGDGLGMRQSRAVREAIDVFDPDQFNSLIITVFTTTFFVELIGFLALSSISESSYFSHLFHSISAFCNAGFSLNADSLASFDTWSLLIMGLLIMVGGLGFPVIFVFWKRLFRKEGYRWPLHLGLVVMTSLILWLSGAVLLALNGEGWGSVFWSVTARTAGFSTSPVTDLSVFALLIMMFLMLIGASPGSTGGGLKTTTFGVMFLVVKAELSAMSKVVFWRRTIPESLIKNAAVLVMVYFVAWLVMLCCLTWLEQSALADGTVSFLSLAFEMTSALGTVGLSMDLTSELTLNSQRVLMVAMILGRLGPLALVVGLASVNGPGDQGVRPEGKVLLG